MALCLIPQTWPQEYFGVNWKGILYVLTILLFESGVEPHIYHSLAEALAVHIIFLGMPIIAWIDSMFGMNNLDVAKYVPNLIKTVALFSDLEKIPKE